MIEAIRGTTMPGARISGPSTIEPERPEMPAGEAPGASARASTPERASPAELEKLWHHRQTQAALAASEVVGGRRNGFSSGRAALRRITEGDPDDWRAHACLALIAWSNGTVDHDALRALAKVNPEQAHFLEWAHAIVEQSLGPDPFHAPSVPKGAKPAIVVPGKQLTPSAEMDGDLLDRMETALDLAKQYPDAPIVLSGGATVTQTTECSVMAQWLIDKGISDKRFLPDPLATVTTANALQTIALLRERPGTNHMFVVTNTGHGRRARVIFELILRRSGSKMTMNLFPAGGGKAGKLEEPANEDERAKVNLDAMHACGLFAFRGRPRFYQRENIIGDEIPGDPTAAVEVALPEELAPGATDDTPQYVSILRLHRGELPRGADSQFLERLLRAFGKTPKAFRLPRKATAEQQKAVIDAIAALGLKHSKTNMEAGYLELCVEPAADPAADPTLIAATIDASPPQAVPPDPIVDGRQVWPAHRRKPTPANASEPPTGPLVIGEPRFLGSPDGNVYLNGSIHARDLDAAATRPDASCDRLRIRIGADTWNEEGGLAKLGSEAARLLRTDGQLVVSTGAEPHVPVGAFIAALTKHGFSVGISAPEETPFYPVMSDPSAGGITFECTKVSPRPFRKRASEPTDLDADGPPRTRVRRDT